MTSHPLEWRRRAKHGVALCILDLWQLTWNKEFYVILTVEYGGNENIHIITSDIPLYFVMRCEASNDKIQWNIGYISWPKGMKYIAKMNEWMIPNTIFLTSRIKIWIHTEWSEQSRGPAKAACGPGPRDCSLHEVWIHIFMRDVKKILWGIIQEFIFAW